MLFSLKVGPDFESLFLLPESANHRFRSRSVDLALTELAMILSQR
jgi:hypothetical protein